MRESRENFIGMKVKYKGMNNCCFIYRIMEEKEDRTMEKREIMYSVTSTPFGQMLVAYTARGICAVSLGDSEEQLTAALLSDFAGNPIRKDQNMDERWTTPLCQYLSGRKPLVELALDLRVTDFRRKVYEVLRAIPLGETRSYEAVAAAMGMPRAVRAVASACARNPISIIIPCHRVLRKDGSLGGYRWGMERKKALLEWENDRSIHANKL